MSNEPNNIAQGETRRGGLHKAVGALLSVIGLFWLAKKAGWIPMDHSHSALFWPVVVIAAGLFIFFSSRPKHTA